MVQGPIQIRNVSQISLPPRTQPPLPIKLSLFGSMWIRVSPIQRLMLYSNSNITFSFLSLVELLKSSLSATILDYLPLAGKLTYVPSTGDVEINFSVEPNINFIEAEADFDIRKLTRSEIHDVESFEKLVPEIDVSVLPFPIFAVQATRFKCGGIAVGYSVHHTVVDGKAMLQFIEAWTSACRAKVNGVDMPIKSHKPLHDRAVVQNPKGEEIARKFLRSLAPNLPSTRSPLIQSKEAKKLHLIRRTFILSASSIQSLKRKATTQQESSSCTSQMPSTFVAISAHVWTSIARTKSFDDPNTELVFVFLMDCRARLDPPISEDYFGPCVRLVFARKVVGELTEKEGLVMACTAIRKAISEVPEDPLSDCEDWIAELQAIPSERLVNVAASPRFKVYEADFGWGGPERSEPVSMNRDGMFVLVGGRGEGTVEVSISLAEDQMETFSELFLGGLSQSGWSQDSIITPARGADPYRSGGRRRAVWEVHGPV